MSDDQGVPGSVTQVRAKFSCTTVKLYPNGARGVELAAVYGASGENKDFCDATPSGKFEMYITGGRPAAEFFLPGQSYYLDITTAP